MIYAIVSTDSLLHWITCLLIYFIILFERNVYYCIGISPYVDRPKRDDFNIKRIAGKTLAWRKSRGVISIVKPKTFALNQDSFLPFLDPRWKNEYRSNINRPRCSICWKKRCICICLQIHFFECLICLGDWFIFASLMYIRPPVS